MAVVVVIIIIIIIIIIIWTSKFCQFIAMKCYSTFSLFLFILSVLLVQCCIMKHVVIQVTFDETLEVLNAIKGAIEWKTVFTLA